jgi:hypothetical protein
MSAATSDETLDLALEATRLLGRWTMVGQRHGQGCSCCPPGLGDISMDDVEKNLYDNLVKTHPVLAGKPSINVMLRDCVARKVEAADMDPLRNLLKDFGGVVDDLEKMQLGFY